MHLLFLGFLILVCLSTAVSSRTEAEDTTTIRIFAAASLTDVINDVVLSFANDAGTPIDPVYGSSSALARQIENGAPADLFISANAEWVDYLIDRGVLKKESRTIIAANSLVLIVPATSKIEILSITAPALVDAFGQGHVAIGDPSGVPAGVYAKQALEHLSVYDMLQSRLVFANDVRQALYWVERGEADAGIVYSTDAAGSSKVRVVATFPDASHESILYLAGLTVGARAGAAAFLDFLSSDSGHKIFAARGFTPPGDGLSAP